MKTYFYYYQAKKTKYGSHKVTMNVCVIKDGKPVFVTEHNFSTGSTRGHISEAMQALVNAGEIDKKYSDSYYSDWNNNDFELIELPSFFSKR